MAEKFSRFRDPGTGIQVFLTPTTSAAGCASSSSLSLGSVLLPLFVVLGVLRSVASGVCWGLYVVTGWSGFLRVVLFALGFVRLRLDHVSNARRKGVPPTAMVMGKAGLVVANHSSWIDLLIISYLFPGVEFVVPVIKEQLSPTTATQQAGVKRRATPKQNAMSANTRIVTPCSPSTSGSPPVVEGYTLLSLTSALPFVGGLPPTSNHISTPIHPTLTAALTSTSTTAKAFFQKS